MRGKGQEAYRKWAPFGVEWSQYVKPVFFTALSEDFGNLSTPAIPWVSDELSRFLDENTAVLIDLPGEESVLRGLALAKRQGYRPIPLYNGVPQMQVGDLDSIVDNRGILRSLLQGADLLSKLNITLGAPPAFLIDSNRNKPSANTEDQFDNRWSLMLEDMPRAEMMRAYKINKLVIWTEGEVKEDLIPIISAYQDKGIEVFLSRGHSISRYGEFQDTAPDSGGQPFVFDEQPQNESQSQPMISVELKKNVRSFKYARNMLLFFTIFAFIQLVVMFGAADEPLIWTSPSLLWLVYLVAEDSIANMVAMALPVIYLVFYLLSRQRREFIAFAAILFTIDTIVLYAFAVSYGLYQFDFLELGTPLIFLYFLISGTIAWTRLKGVSEEEFQRVKALVIEEKKNYRGYGGYGGWRGGYRGGFGGGGFGG